MDLNLLIALDTLLREGSVAKAAARLSLSPPAMSRTLTRIREATGDPILVRAGRGLVPTPRAVAMQDEVRAVVERAARLLAPGAPSRPEEFVRSFAIRANDALIWSLGARLIARAAKEAPKVVLRFVPEGDEDVDALRDGRVDLDIGVQGALGPEIRMQQLSVEHSVALVRKENHLASGRVTSKRFAAASHLLISRRGKSHGPIDRELAKEGLARHVAAVVPSFGAALSIVSTSDLVVTVPAGVAATAARTFEVVSFRIPLELESLAFAMAWHPRFDADPAHAWLRDGVRASFRAPK
ncbi:LysR family transcriptional regulator [Pendulispora albinea]|uniref:LysR family transcriptional regulator n=1 Tax=Pendulispora albinea TaxID=2741071 RepID=A0ABZ2LRE5_9BACT